MPRAIWSGAISFGLVNIPVRLFTAVSSKEIHFHMLHGADGARIEQKRFCSAEGREVPYDQIVKGYELSPSRWVTISPEELEAIDPEATHTVDIQAFVDGSEIDPVYYESTYHVAPDKGAAKAYSLLLEAMRRAGKVALARVVLRTRERLCSLRPQGAGLALSMLNHADELVSQESVGLPVRVESSERELIMAGQLIESLSAPFDPARYPDTYRERVLELVRRKSEGEQLVSAPSARPAEIANLADALAASLAARERSGARATSPKDEAEPPAEGERRHRAEAARTARSGQRRTRRGGS
jgi:DNA end-binding protein Ku